MVLPSQDPKNPLHGLTVSAQCAKLFTNGTRLRPWNILSLNPNNYAEDQVKKAYHDLSRQLHPDKNSGIKYSNEAFNLIKQAAEYMFYGLKKGNDKQQEFDVIRKNPFYQIYGEYTDESSQVKLYEIMNFRELISEAEKDVPISEALMRRIKQFIISDKALLSVNIRSEYIRNKEHVKTPLHILSQNGEVDFIIWLLEHSSNNGKISRESICCVIECGRLDVLQSLLQRHGPSVYDLPKFSSGWNYLHHAIEYNVPEIADFLLNALNYQNLIENSEYVGTWQECIRHSTQDCSAITALLLKYHLLKDINNSFYYAVVFGAISAAKLIFQKKPQYDMERLYNSYISHHFDGYNHDLAEAPEFLINLFDLQKPGVAKLRAIIGNINKNFDDWSSSPEEKQRSILAALLPPLYERLYQHHLSFNDDEEYYTPHEEILFNSLYWAAINDSYEVLKKLIAISPAPLMNTEYLKCSPLLSIFLKICCDSSINYDRIITLLINTGEPLVSVGTQERYGNDASDYIHYLKYTALHFTCELNLQKHFEHLLEKISRQDCALDAICHKKERQTQSEPFTHYYYTALHLALAKNNEDMALKLIKAGADYRLKAVIQRTKSSSCCFFSKIEHIEKTPLQMAIEQNQTKVIRVIQAHMLDEYLVNRQKEENYLSHFTVFGYRLFSFGYFNQSDKLKAAKDLKEAINSGTVNLNQLNKVHRGALNQGRLGYIAQLSNYLPEVSSYENQYLFH